MEDKVDGGYGNIGNMSVYIFLSTLPINTRKDYEEYLKKQDSESYGEYKKWEEHLNG